MLLGVDISHWQDSINHQGVRDAGNAFLVAKLTEGSSNIDGNGLDNIAHSKRVGMFPGAYHFARGGDPVGEASHFLKNLKDPNGVFVALDWEIAFKGNAPAWCLTWLRQVESALGIKPLIYMDQSRLNGNDWSSVISNGNQLWLAKYDGSTDPPATTWRCMMKQFTDKGRVPGIGGNVDRDAYYGFAQDLQNLCVGGATVSSAQSQSQSQGEPWLALPTLTHGMMNNPAVRSLQGFMVKNFGAYNRYSPTGNYLDQTAAGIAEFQRRLGITGPDADGKTVGPRTKRALWDHGWRG
jgi:lysozyme